MKIKPYAFPTMLELNLWPAWNDAVASGEVPLEDKDGNQFLGLGGTSVMKVYRDPTGWVVEVWEEAAVREHYQKPGKPWYYDLHKAKAPYRLE